MKIWQIFIPSRLELLKMHHCGVVCWTHSFGLAACKRKKREPAVKNVAGKKICVSNWRTFYILSTYLSSFLKKRSPKCMLTSSAKQQTSVELYMCSSGYGIYTLHLRGKIVFTGRIVLLSTVRYDCWSFYDYSQGDYILLLEFFFHLLTSYIIGRSWIQAIHKAKGHST